MQYIPVACNDVQTVVGFATAIDQRAPNGWHADDATGAIIGRYGWRFMKTDQGLLIDRLAAGVGIGHRLLYGNLIKADDPVRYQQIKKDLVD